MGHPACLHQAAGASAHGTSSKAIKSWQLRGCTKSSLTCSSAASCHQSVSNSCGFAGLTPAAGITICVEARGCCGEQRSQCRKYVQAGAAPQRAGHAGGRRRRCPPPGAPWLWRGGARPRQHRRLRAEGPSMRHCGCTLHTGAVLCAEAEHNEPCETCKRRQPSKPGRALTKHYRAEPTQEARGKCDLPGVGAARRGRRSTHGPALTRRTQKSGTHILDEEMLVRSGLHTL